MRESKLSPAGALVRTGEWWDHKLVPIFCGFYASALVLGVPIASLWDSALILLLSLIPGAAYVSVVNDLTDLDSDAAAGKPNRMAPKPAWFRAAALILPLAAGGLFFWLWRDKPLLLILYGAAWIAFTLYSVPPFRLKARGLAGVVADASGAHLFPTLLAAALPFVAASRTPDPLWLWAVAAWSFAYGFRGNLWHQLLDRDGDRAAGVATFAAGRGPEMSVRLARLAFAVEASAMAAMLWRMGSALPLLALAAYGLLMVRRVRLWGLQPVIAEPRPNYLILLHEYYDVFLPLSILAASALLHRADAAVPVVHLLLFHGRALDTWRDSWRLINRPALQRLRILGPPRRGGSR
jgi:4-hydroxybenzoate polyprenyltransferase